MGQQVNRSSKDKTLAKATELKKININKYTIPAGTGVNFLII